MAGAPRAGRGRVRRGRSSCWRRAEPVELRPRVAAPCARLPRTDLRPARGAREREQGARAARAQRRRPAADERSEALAARGVGGGGRRQRRGSRAAAGCSSAPTRVGERSPAHLRRRPRPRARADAPRPVRRVLRAVDRRRRGDRRAGRPDLAYGCWVERRQRRQRGRRARARRSSSSIGAWRRSPGTGSKASRSTCWQRDRSCSGGSGRLDEARAAAEAEQALAEQLGAAGAAGDGQPRPRLVALAAGEYELAADAAR